MKKKTQEQFVNEVNNSNPNVKIIGTYINDSTKIDVMCLNCNKTWKARPNILIRGSGCPYCANNIKKTTTQFIDEMKEYNPYIEIKGEYETAHTPIKVKCRICGNEWEAKPNRLLQGAQCMNCIKPHTSFMEQFILISFKKVLGEKNVISRDTSAIGVELDIYIPKYNLAIEPGTWLYHEKKLNNIDMIKRNKCRERGIRLITIYDTYPKDKNKPFGRDCYVFDGFLNEYGYKRLIDLIIELFNLINIKDISLDWKEIANLSYEACHINAHEDFINKLHEVNPNLVVLDKFKGSHTPILVKNKKCNHKAWEARPYTLLKGIGCPECGRLKAAKTRTRTNEQFVKEMSTISPTIKIIGKYKKVTERIEVECLVCGKKWTPLCYSLLSGKGCPHCSAVKGAKKAKKIDN